VVAFGEARRAGCTVLTFTMPDPAAINPLGAPAGAGEQAQCDHSQRGRGLGVLVMDFEAYPVAKDPRLWFEDRLHGNTLGHIKVAAGLAWRLGIDGFDERWADLLEGEAGPPRPRVPITGDFDWAVNYLLPWLGKGIRRLPRGLGIERKRPVPTVVPKSPLRVD
jgi:hypothetical protein